MTNSFSLAQMLNELCKGDHQHEHIIGSDSKAPRSSQSQVYPPRLVDAVLRTYGKTCGRKVHDIHWTTAAEICLEDQQIDERYFGNPPTACYETKIVHEILGEENLDGDKDNNNAEQESTTEDDPTTGHRFPGSGPVSLERLVKRAHEGLGHPGKERFLRILKSSKANKQVMDIAKILKCNVCENFKGPKQRDQRHHHEILE